MSIKSKDNLLNYLDINTSSNKKKIAARNII